MPVEAWLAGLRLWISSTTQSRQLWVLPTMGESRSLSLKQAGANRTLAALRYTLFDLTELRGRQWAVIGFVLGQQLNAQAPRSTYPLAALG